MPDPAMQEVSAKLCEDSAPEPVGAFRYMARQPILDQRSKVHGYELLFRSGPELTFRGDGNLATRTMIDNTVMFGLERLTSWMPAFVNCTTESLTGDMVQVLPPGIAVLEILEDLEPTPRLIEACRKLKAAGFRLALDDFVWRPGIEPLVALANYVKVDFMKLGAAERKELLLRLRGTPVCLIAEKVETQEDFKQACAEGFKLFQGFFFCRPLLLKNGRVPANRLSQIEILGLLQHDPMNLPRLSEAVKREASLAYRLLRLVNSPVCAIRQEVTSIESALMVVGEDTFRRMATLAIASEFNANQPLEILRMAFVRARFCELAAGLCGLSPTEQYLIGLLSMFPAMLRVPMENLVPALPLREDLRNALLGSDVPQRSLLHWLECDEQGDWEGCDAIVLSNGLCPDQLMRCYIEAVDWAETAFKSSSMGD
jgi:EAL and modified HD-GYP domain-containing signal transduction protein